jgi:hypothetical protein
MEILKKVGRFEAFFGGKSMNPVLHGECTIYPVFGAEMHVTAIEGLF